MNILDNALVPWFTLSEINFDRHRASIHTAIPSFPLHFLRKVVTNQLIISSVELEPRRQSCLYHMLKWLMLLCFCNPWCSRRIKKKREEDEKSNGGHQFDTKSNSTTYKKGNKEFRKWPLKITSYIYIYILIWLGSGEKMRNGVKNQ